MRFGIFLLTLLYLNISFSQKSDLTENQIKENRIKEVKVFIKYDGDFDGFLTNRKTFNESGQIVFNKEYSLFDYKLSSKEYHYKYNKHGDLSKKIYIQYVYKGIKENLKKIDSTKIKTLYGYNKKGDLLKESISFDNEEISVVGIYAYNSNFNLEKVNFTDYKKTNLPYKYNRIDTYEYNNKNQVIKQVYSFKNSALSGHTDYFQYDELGNKIVKKRIQNSKRSESHISYKYDLNNNLIEYTTWSIRAKEKTWVLTKQFEYNDKSVLISHTIKRSNGFGEKTIFKLNDLNLVSKEIVYSNNGNEKMSFEIIYEYF